MHIIDASYTLTHQLTYRARLLLTIVSFALCIGLYTSYYQFSHEGAILAIPLALAAWMFRRFESWIFFLCTLLAIAAINTLSLHTLVWPRALVLAFLISSAMLLAEVYFIHLIALTIDMREMARQKAEQARQELMNAYEQQRMLNQLKEQFILNINHELRTPFTEIQGYLELLNTYREELDTPTQNIFLKNALRGCEELKEMIDEVLNVSLLSQGLPSPKYASVHIASIVQETIDLFDPLKRTLHPIQVDIPDQLTVWADQQHVKQILRNLLSNAFKYSLPGTAITISVRSEERVKQPDQTSRHIYICVKDYGHGIPPQELPLLFEKFIRLQRDLAGTERGSGLGLYISKQLVEAMGGRIWVESSGVPGEGSSFTFQLPDIANPNIVAQKEPEYSATSSYSMHD